MNLLGIDVGTTSVKAGVFDENGNLIRLCQEDYILMNNGSFIEFEAEEYFNIVKRVITEVSQGLFIDALSVDSQGETLILCDSKGNPLRRAIVWLDNRAENEAQELKKEFGEKTVYELTGQPEITSGWPACKLLWIKRNEPDVWEKTRKVFLLEDFILFRLSGEFVSEKTLQSSAMYFNINTCTWWNEMLSYIGIPIEYLPTVLNPGELVGYYGKTAVVTGSLDQIAGAIGAGVIKEGIISEMTGSTMAIVVPTENMAPYNPNSKIPFHLSATGKILLMWTPTAGLALKWFKNNFCDNTSFSELDEHAKGIPMGSEGLMMLPFLCGSTMPLYNPDASGVFYGINLKHTRIHFYRAILESVAYMLKSDLDYLNLKNLEEIRVMGGGASSSLWCQIKADMTGKKLVTLKNNETACLGSAILAGIGIGVYSSLEAACTKVVKTDKIYLPSGENYNLICERYKKLENLILFGGII